MSIYDEKKKIAVIAISGFLLLAMIAAVVVGILTSEIDTSSEEHGKLTSHTKKAIEAFCQPTHYKKECVKSLDSGAPNIKDKDDPKQLAAEVFNRTRAEIASALAKFPSINSSINDARGRHAIEICRTVAKIAIRDLQRAETSFHNYGKGVFDLFMEDLRVWIGGALADQDVCLDSFHNSTGKAGEKMKALMFKSRELTVDSLAVIIEINGKRGSLHAREKGGEEEEEEEENGGEGKGHGEEKGGEEEEKGGEGKDHGEEKGGEEEEKGGIKEKEKADEGKEGELQHVQLAGELPEWINDQKRNILEMPVADIKADVVVAKDGSGKATTVREAIHMAPKKSQKAFVIRVKEGLYHENLAINGRMTSVILVGDGPNKTIISSAKNFADGWPAYVTATLDVDGDGFMARDIGFENTAGPDKLQASAACVSSDYTIFYNCHFSGFDTTLYAVRSRHFYRDCTISGSIDIIAGDALAVFQNCHILVRAPVKGRTSVVTAQARTDSNGPGAFILQNCTIMSETPPGPAQPKAFLGRPMKPYSRTIVMQSFLGDIIAPEGWTSMKAHKWLPFVGKGEHKTVFYVEFENKGPGSEQSGRVKWEGIKKLPEEKMVPYSPSKFFSGADQWITDTGCPYYGNMLPSAK